MHPKGTVNGQPYLEGHTQFGPMLDGQMQRTVDTLEGLKTGYKSEIIFLKRL